MSRGYKNYQSWRLRTKIRLVMAFGGGCGICRYNRCNRNLVFHHVDPAKKSFAITSKRMAGWNALITEVEKCVLLCANCHGEVHSGLINNLDECPRFSQELFGIYTPRPNKKLPTRTCKICNAILSNRFKKGFCSQKCWGESQRKPITKEMIILAMNDSGGYWYKAASEFGMTGAALRKLAMSRGVPNDFCMKCRKENGGRVENRTPV